MQHPAEDIGPAPPGFEGPSAVGAAKERWRRRLLALFSVRAPQKTQRDVDSAVEYFTKPETGGWDEMWRQAIKKYGAEPTPEEVRRAFWRNKLSAYFLLVDSTQSPRDIEDCLDYFEHRLEGYEGMWIKVQRKYGLVVDASQQAAREEEKVIGDVVVERTYKNVLSGAIEPRVVVIVVVSGVSYRLYHAAPPAMQFKFNSAVAAEVKYCAEFPNTLHVCKVTEHVDGVTIEMETQSPEGTQTSGSLLVHYVNSGNFPTGLIRKAYLEFIQGNPAKVFVMEVAVVESRQTANYRGSILIRPEPSDGRLAHRLPSIDESRELVLARREARGAHTYGYILDQEGSQALYEPPPPPPEFRSGGAAADSGVVSSTASVGNAKRTYPPPLSAFQASQPARNVSRSIGGELISSHTAVAYDNRRM
ncbi:Hypothetical protein, putative [Bodo saltans]|uniref:Uncharacterized protein n=1 Tax=Bodo saltans TaxID=75058 RepID=A0A0S4IWH1_BODSA|nr:Hypothetical protein, putative [Bodo saltans]|eukprot:CUG06185.1 Hypothetical protein, putative [Bodo saltans]